MKLRNKKTGDTIDVVVNPTEFNTIRLCRVNTVKSLQAVNTWEYNTLSELSEEWEDYEETKEFYVVDLDGEILPSDFEDKTMEKSKEIGNYFETKEEAELAVRKLKAWKRLKDNGFKFEEWKPEETYWGDYNIIATDQTSCDDKDLDLLFGGEE